MKKQLISELQNLSIVEIQEKILELKKEIILMTIKQKTQQNIKPHIIKNKKHELAQILTLETLKRK